MIDWYTVGFSALWIFGMGLEVAVWSFAYYIAKQQNLKISQVIAIPHYRVLLGLGLVFFCLGMIGAAMTIWERGAWAILTLIFIWWTLRGKKGSDER